jgi:hypothetical protein
MPLHVNVACLRHKVQGQQQLELDMTSTLPVLVRFQISEQHLVFYHPLVLTYQTQLWLILQ